MGLSSTPAATSGSVPRPSRSSRSRPTARLTCCASLGTSATATCRCRSPTGGCACAPTTSSPRWCRASAVILPGATRRSIRKSAPMPRPRPAMSTERAGLYRLLAWLSPSFPTGAFSYSHGLEAAAAAGVVHDRASLEGWVAAIVARGSGRIDADIVRDAYDAAQAGDRAVLDAANRRGVAYRATAELALESAQQGAAFLSTCVAAWPEPFIEAWAGRAARSNKD